MIISIGYLIASVAFKIPSVILYFCVTVSRIQPLSVGPLVLLKSLREEHKLCPVC